MKKIILSVAPIVLLVLTASMGCMEHDKEDETITFDYTDVKNFYNSAVTAIDESDIPENAWNILSNAIHSIGSFMDDSEAKDFYDGYMAGCEAGQDDYNDGVDARYDACWGSTMCRNNVYEGGFIAGYKDGYDLGDCRCPAPDKV